MSESLVEQPKRRMTKTVVVLALVVVLLVAACTVLFMQYRKVNSEQQKTVAAQTARLTAQLGKAISLPGEQPTLATVLDKTKLGDQQLATEALNGDQLLIYPKARQVILYRPASQRVIDMFHVESTAQATTNATTTPVAATNKQH